MLQFEVQLRCGSATLALSTERVSVQGRWR
jgi:hypothetical protein